MPIELPTEPSTPAVRMSDFRWLIHGLPKVGKTTLATFFPGALFAKCEEGTKGLSLYGVSISSWADMVSLIDKLDTETHQFQTIIIDPIERLYEFLADQVAADNRVNTIGDIGYGGGYAQCNQRMRNMLEILYAQYGVVLISHTRFIDKTLRGMQIGYAAPDLSTSYRSMVLGWVDVTVYLNVEDVVDKEGKTLGTRRVAICQPLPEVEAGGRLRYMPDSVILGSTPQEGYEALKAAFEDAAQRFLDEVNVPKE